MGSEWQGTSFLDCPRFTTRARVLTRPCRGQHHSPLLVFSFIVVNVMLLHVCPSPGPCAGEECLLWEPPMLVQLLDSDA